jgi:hypothetical protein
MTEDSMEMLLKRAVNFRRKDYENNKDLFNKLKEQQTPHTLFISGNIFYYSVPYLMTQELILT